MLPALLFPHGLAAGLRRERDLHAAPDPAFGVHAGQAEGVHLAADLPQSRPVHTRSSSDADRLCTLLVAQGGVQGSGGEDDRAHRPQLRLHLWQWRGWPVWDLVVHRRRRGVRCLGPWRTSATEFVKVVWRRRELRCLQQERSCAWTRQRKGHFGGLLPTVD